jgi:hypothetical protein
VAARTGLIPNPWPPDSIVRLIEHALTTPGLAFVVYKLIALWIEDRKARSVKVKCGEYEVELTGGVTGAQIRRAFTAIRNAMGGVEREDVKVVLPPRINRSVPVEMVRKANQQKGHKR